MGVIKVLVDIVSIGAGITVLSVGAIHYGTMTGMDTFWDNMGRLGGLIGALLLVFGVPGLLELISEYEKDIAELKSSLELARSTSHDTKEAK